MRESRILFGSIAFFLYFSTTTLNAEVSQSIELPDISDSTGTLISPREEKELGDAFFRNIHRQLIINEDLEVQSYIQSLGHKLVAHAESQQSPFHFLLSLIMT